MATITTAAAGANLPAFLDLIAFSEGTSTESATKNNGYDVIVTGEHGQEVFTDYSNHPFANRPPQVINSHLQSTAAGRYQILYKYYLAYKRQLNLPDFSPLSQDLIAIQQIKERKALPMIESGDIRTAIKACSNIWASLPGNDYGQGGRSLPELLAKWQELSHGQ